ILNALLEEVLDDPKLNSEDYLEKKVLELKDLSEKELQKLGEKGKEKKEGIEREILGEINKKYGVE
ncbi:hypothetical protein KW783_04290, partial [Candidatus Parcubacteria bacterium]|nr:hypothetical protein [Candidatus Parcubacteria bacterium]